VEAGSRFCRLLWEYSWDSITYDPNQAHVELARLYSQQGEKDKARQVLETVAYSQTTFRNFQFLADTVMGEVGRLVILGYPTRSVLPLQAMVVPQEDVVFVENETNFLQALERYEREQIFIDHSGVDFGHLTSLGHELVATRLAQTIRESWYSGAE